MAGLPRAMIGKAAAVVAVAGILGFGLIRGGGSSAEPAVQTFLLAWENGQYKAAAAMTTGQPAVVAAALASAYRQLDAADLVMQMGRITQHGTAASADFHASVDLGSGGLRWTYRGSFAMRRTSAGWKVVWSPSVIVPGLHSGDRLAVLTTMPGRAPILDAAGLPLTVPAPLYVLGVRPDALASPRLTAAALARVTGLDPNQIYGQIIAAPSKEFLGLVRLPPPGYARLYRRLRRVPGLVVHRRTERLFDSIAPEIAGSVGTETAMVLRQEGVPYRPGDTVGLSGLEAAYQRGLTGSPTTEVVLQNAAGRRVAVLQHWAGSPGQPVRTTIDQRVQAAADHALAGLPGSGAIVAIQPGTGRILAVAEHTMAGMPAVSPLAGRYTPGQAFTIVSTAALLQSGFNTSSPVPCRAENSIGGRRFSNQPAELNLGSSPPFSVDFAHACGTAFAGLSEQLDAKDLAVAARGFGIGASWQLKIASYPGTIGNPMGYGQVAATSIGAGDVRVSPLDMALAAGLVQSGTWHSPALVTGGPDPSSAPDRPFSAGIVASLRALMRATVTKGAGAAANVPGGRVFGQVGNSALGPGPGGLRSTWFVGFRGKIAFAAVEFAKSTNVSAAPLAGQFLRDIQG